jgi:hypothetical protein
MQEWHQRWATEALRVAKPGAYLLAFGGTRTYHRLACAIEDAGWIIRDCLVWAYASGFPKSKALLKPAWEPIVMARKPGPLRELAIDACRIPTDERPVMVRTSTVVAATAMAGESTGATASGDMTTLGRWPANVVLTDPIFDGGIDGVVGGGEVATRGSVVSGKSYAGSTRTTHGFGTMAEGFQLTGYGDTGTYSRFFELPEGPGCYLCGRVRDAGDSSDPVSQRGASAVSPAPIWRDGTPDSMATAGLAPRPNGHDSTTSETASASLSDDAANTPHILRSRQHEIWPESEPELSPAKSLVAASPVTGTTMITADRWTCATCADLITSDTTSSYPRFYLVSKADRAEREPVFGGLDVQFSPTMGNGIGAREHDPSDPRSHRRNHHPTVKPLDLMRHLVRLVTPPSGTVLDPFLGSGTTAIAAEMEGFAWLGIEREAEYVAIAEARLQGVQKGLGLAI